MGGPGVCSFAAPASRMLPPLAARSHAASDQALALIVVVSETSIVGVFRCGACMYHGAPRGFLGCDVRTVRAALCGTDIMQLLRQREAELHNFSRNGCTWHQVNKLFSALET